MKNFFARLKRAWANYKNKRAWLAAYNENREWVAVSPSANVPLGPCDYDTAMLRANRVGPIAYVDMEAGIIFVNLPGHSGNPPPDGFPGISS